MFEGWTRAGTCGIPGPYWVRLEVDLKAGFAFYNDPYFYSTPREWRRSMIGLIDD